MTSAARSGVLEMVSIATKVFTGFLVLLAGFGALAAVSIAEIGLLARDLQVLERTQLRLSRVSTQLETHQQNRIRDLRRGLEETELRGRRAILRIGEAYYPDVLGDAAAQLTQIVRASPLDPDYARTLLEHVEAIAAGHERLTALTREALSGPAASHVETLQEVELALRSESYRLNKRISDETDRLVRSALAKERLATWRVLWMTVGALVVGLFATLLAGRAVSPIGGLVRYARAISRGDYDQPLATRRRDELGGLADELRWMAQNRKTREAELDRQARELERAYARVEELRLYNESVVQSLRTAVLVTDRELRISSVNRAAMHAWGLDPSVVKGQPLSDLPLGRHIVSRFAWDAEGGTRTGEGLEIDDRVVDVTAGPLEREAGRPLGWVVTVEDVTETAATKEALIRSERLAAIGRMSAHVTHELRNPLSSIGLNAELLGDTVGDDSAEARELCAAIGREVDRLSELTAEYLRFARLPRPELQRLEIEDFVEAIASFMAPECRAAGVTLEVHVDRETYALADPDQLRQALINLLRNAREAMPEGGRIDIRVQTHDDAIEISVEDEGSGIPESDLDKIFDPFHSTKLTGTGLGLALTQQIISEHGGSLSVRSNEGRGSLFSIRLPRGQPPVPPRLYSEPPSTDVGKPRIPRKISMLEPND